MHLQSLAATVLMAGTSQLLLLTTTTSAMSVGVTTDAHSNHGNAMAAIDELAKRQTDCCPCAFLHGICNYGCCPPT